jgi:hypothetical protein
MDKVNAVFTLFKNEVESENFFREVKSIDYSGRDFVIFHHTGIKRIYRYAKSMQYDFELEIYHDDLLKIQSNSDKLKSLIVNPNKSKTLTGGSVVEMIFESVEFTQIKFQSQTCYLGKIKFSIIM